VATRLAPERGAGPEVGIFAVAGLERMNDDDESPGVPGFRNWRGIYLLVFAAFILVVIGLAIFARVYA
jgi:hypothetical protein